MNIATLRERWDSYTPRVRALIIGIASLVVVVLIAIGVGMWQYKSSQVPLFAKPLSTNQVGEVDSQLSTWQMSFTTIADNVIVDRGQRDDILLRLSMLGIPHEDLTGSSDALSKIGALTPQSVIDVQTRDAVANDLALGLRGVDGIADARVIIAPAKEAFFADEDSHSATASVRLSMQSGRTLTREVVDGIRRFVANGVSGLAPEHVAVMDDSGKPLGDDAEMDTTASKGIQLTVQSALDKALGPGLAIVTVQTELNKTVRHEYAFKNLPVEGAPISKNFTDERLAAKDKAYSNTHGTETRGSQGLATRSEIAPGGISRLSVAVIIDQSLQDEEPEIRAIVAAAAGIDSGRGDVLTVAPLAFPHPSVSMVASGQGMLFFYHALPGFIIGIFVLGVFFLAMQPLITIMRRNANREILSQTRALEPGVDIAAIWRTIHSEPAHVAAAVISQLPTSTAVAVLDMYPEQERREITERLARPIAPVLVDIVKVPTHA